MPGAAPVPSADQARIAPTGKHGRAFASLNAVLKSNLRRSADGRKVVSHATIADRAEFYSRMIRQLHEAGYALTDVKNLKPRHVTALMRLWEAQGLSASTLQKRFSYLTLLCGWIGKQSMLQPGPSYLVDPDRYQRVYAADHDHSWTATGVDPHVQIASIAQDDPDVARVLRLQHAFGLRIQEASLLSPARDVQGNRLRVVAGAKGGRPRTVPIETDAQRAVLAEAAHHAQTTQRSMIPPDRNLKEWLAHCYTVLARHGITRRNRLVSHGLRHGYANDRFEELTGEPSPVRGGQRPDDDADLSARREVSARLGHARTSITAAYYGTDRPAPVTPPAKSTALARERSVQQRLLAERLKGHIDQRRFGRGPIAERTLDLRWKMLNQLLTVLARQGVPWHPLEPLSVSQVDGLLAHWRSSVRLAPASADNQMQFLAQLCGWLDQPDLAAHVRTAWIAVTPSLAAAARPWDEETIQARLQAIRGQDARVALHIELVRVVGLTHRQAGRLQPGQSYRDGMLDVIWETPSHQVLRYPIVGPRQQAVLAAALALLPEPAAAVCPVELSLAGWLRRVYDRLRSPGGIGTPGAPTLADLKDPEAPRPIALPREAYLLERAGLARANDGRSSRL